MALLDVLRSGVGIANKVTRSLQATVSYWRFVSEDNYGAKTYSPVLSGAGAQLHAVVDYKSIQVRTQGGELTVSRAVITLLDIDEVVVATNGLGIDNNDIFKLPDGDTGPILDIRGFIDAGTGHPIATEVMLG